MDDTTGWSRRGLLGAGAAALATGAMAGLAGPAAAQPGGNGKGHGNGHGNGQGKGNGNGNGHGAGGSGALPEDRIGLQMFTVRELMADNELDLPGTLEILADAGIAEVELAGDYDGRTPREVRRLVESFGLTIAGNHFGPRTMVQNTWYDRAERARIFEESHTLGLRQVGTGHSYVAPLTVDGYKEMAAAFNQWGEEAVRDGFDFFYFHNHDLEFTVVDGRPLYDILLEETDPRYVQFELDLGWVTVGGFDPYDYLREHGDRFPMFHVKDIRWDDAGPRAAHASTINAGRRFRFVDVGKGDVDWARAFSALDDLRDHHYLIEHDDAGDDETPDATSPRPRNPAGPANTVWTSRKFLGEVRAPRGRR
jgi:sugar phosphate isomerase/epimerase